MEALVLKHILEALQSMQSSCSELKEDVRQIRSEMRLLAEEGKRRDENQRNFQAKILKFYVKSFDEKESENGVSISKRDSNKLKYTLKDDSDEELEPFAPHISNTPFPYGFELPHLSSYDGTTDLTSHLSTFNMLMRATNVNAELRCMLFPTTLTGPAKSWFDKFRRHSITSWEQLSSDFKKQFRAAWTIKPGASSLANIKQKAGETLKQYLVRFSLAEAQAWGVDDSSHLMAIRAGILPASPFWKDLQKKPVYDLAEFNRRAQCAVRLEEAELMLNNPDAASASESKKPDSGSVKKSQKGSKRKNDNSQGDGSKKKKWDNQYVPLYQVHTELNQSREQIFLANEKTVPFRRADTMRGPKNKRDPNKYCRYHRDRGHTTDEC